MTITIKLSAAEEARLRAQAGRERRDPETIIHALVRSAWSRPPPRSCSTRPSPRRPTPASSRF